LLVCFKTLIYGGQLCNNALNYPNTPLIKMFPFLHARFRKIRKWPHENMSPETWSASLNLRETGSELDVPSSSNPITPIPYCISFAGDKSPAKLKRAVKSPQSRASISGWSQESLGLNGDPELWILTYENKVCLRYTKYFISCKDFKE
jgi:hypothetical protein